VTALPVWISYMEKVLKGVPEILRTAPEGIVDVRLDADGGTPAGKRPEYFYRENAPGGSAEPPPVTN
jgi:penicillin-binding protein 1A